VTNASEKTEQKIEDGFWDKGTVAVLIRAR
jgi:hypothetical protein